MRQESASQPPLRARCERCEAEARFVTPHGLLCPEDALLDLVHAPAGSGWFPIAIERWYAPA